VADPPSKPLPPPVGKALDPGIHPDDDPPSKPPGADPPNKPLSPPVGKALGYGVRCDTSETSPQWQDILIALSRVRHDFHCEGGLWNGKLCSQLANFEAAQFEICAEIRYNLPCVTFAGFGYSILASCVRSIGGIPRAGGDFFFDRLDARTASHLKLS
jgi:hypothetical protein